MPWCSALVAVRHLRRPADCAAAHRGPEERAIVWQLLRAHEYWRSKRLAVDLVILNERQASYVQDLQRFLEGMVAAAARSAGRGSRAASSWCGPTCSTAEESELLQCAARVTSERTQGSLAEQVARMRRARLARNRAPAVRRRRARRWPHVALDAPQLEFFNGLGGFAEGGREYVTVLGPGQRTPAPWINVIANPQLGFLVSESGSGYTWSHEQPREPADAMVQRPGQRSRGEAFYLRDDDTGELWTPTAAADSRRIGALRRAPRPGIQPL